MIVSMMKKIDELSTANDILKKENETLKDRLQNTDSGIRAKCAACRFLEKDCITDCPFLNFIPGEDPKKFFSIYVIHGFEWMEKLPKNFRDNLFHSMYSEAQERILNLGDENVHLIWFLRKRISTLTAGKYDMKKENEKLQTKIKILLSYLGEGCIQQQELLEEAAKCVVCNLIGRGCEEGCIFRESVLQEKMDRNSLKFMLLMESSGLRIC